MYVISQSQDIELSNCPLSSGEKLQLLTIHTQPWYSPIRHRVLLHSTTKNPSRSSLLLHPQLPRTEPPCPPTSHLLAGRPCLREQRFCTHQPRIHQFQASDWSQRTTRGQGQQQHSTSSSRPGQRKDYPRPPTVPFSILTSETVRCQATLRRRPKSTDEGHGLLQNAADPVQGQGCRIRHQT